MADRTVSDELWQADMIIKDKIKYFDIFIKVNR